VEQNLVLAGVGGQGILTIAKAISIAASRRGWRLKQAEVHGMSQRGGAVQSHLRLADHALHSDLIPAGCVDMVLAVEPLESLRYAHLLAEDGVVVASASAFVNIGNYPPIERVLDRIAALPQHVLVDADRVARAAGSGRSSNIVTLGAASLHLPLDADELEDAVAELFASKGEKVVSVNRRAFRFGRNAAAAYADGIRRGGTSRAVRHWIETLDEDQLAAAERPDGPVFDVVEPGDQLSAAEAHAVERILWHAYEDERAQLFEHEVYQIIQLVGAIDPPHHLFVGSHELISEEALAGFPGDRVVLKIVSPDLTHKSDVGGVVFCHKDLETVRAEMTRLIRRHQDGARVEGVLVVEYVEPAQHGLGGELFVGVRQTREFGPIIAAGLGGVDTEYLARALRPGLAVAKAVATDISAEQFMELFRQTAAYDMLSGRARGHRRVVSDGELLRAFRAFISLATRFCVDRGDVCPDLGELEVNPFSFRRQRLAPLDGRGRLETAARRLAPRPLDRLRRMLEPNRVALVGVSAGKRGFGRIVLDNMLECGLDPERLTIVKPAHSEIAGVRCAPSISELPEPVDLLVVATSADQLPAIVGDCVDSGNVGGAILIPGGVGETEGSEHLERQVRDAIARGRERKDGGPVFVGPNCLGVQSRPGRYDTFFVPRAKLPTRRDGGGSGVALISQSGAFIVSRLSGVASLDPTLTLSMGNQLDVTMADALRVVGERDDIHTIGLYAEGFRDLDGLDLLQTLRDLTSSGVTVVFYKAGRTEAGRDAAAGHTAAIAGDYDICESGAEAAGAIVAQTFAEFERLLEVAAATRGKAVRGTRIGAISNAGFEAVGMADSTAPGRGRVEMAELSPRARAALVEALRAGRLGGLVDVRNPLDLTPMAGEDAYEAVARAMLEADTVDALVVSCVPLTPALATTADEIAAGRSLADVLARLNAETDKPIVAVIDSGSLYEPLVERIRSAGVPTLRSADDAVRALGRVLASRAPRGPGAETGETKPGAAGRPELAV
jgi:indolepyruvate ferredoxin oxidoreductase beta subunit